MIDLAWNIDCCEILQWCHDNGVLYVNTSVEVWDPFNRREKEASDRKDPLLAAYEDSPAGFLLENARADRGGRTWRQSRPDFALDRHGLINIAGQLIADGKAKGARKEELETYIRERRFNYLAWKLGVKVIHCSERDTQISDKPKEVDEFVNTWSIEGFREEGTTTAEMGWAHTRKHCRNTRIHTRKGRKTRFAWPGWG